jgi:hypothetical protein
MNKLVVSGGDIVHRECGVAFYQYLTKFNLFEEGRTPSPAFCFILYKVYMVIPVRACESKIFRNLAGNQIPVFPFKPGEKVFYTILRTL